MTEKEELIPKIKTNLFIRELLNFPLKRIDRIYKAVIIIYHPGIQAG